MPSGPELLYESQDKLKIFFSIYNNKLFSFYVAATGSNATVGATDWILPIVYYDYRFVFEECMEIGRKS